MESLSTVNVGDIINSLSDGVYVCDLDRRVTYWSKSAERITGWTAEDVVGRQCFDNILCHIDKDGHQLCGEEHCPLHRAIVTSTGSKGSLLVYARGKNGRRIPMQVAVAPIRNTAGQVVGGVETFRDASAMVHDLERAKAIQQLALEQDVPEGGPVSFTTHYISHEIVGGDYYAIKKLSDDQYGIMLADVMGHGVAAALYTMHLSSLWGRYHRLLANPVEFAGKVNNELVNVVKGDESFATAVCGLVDVKNHVFRFTGAGGPQVLLMHADGTHECLESPGLPLAVMEDAPYEETTAEVHNGDRLLLFSDGALEVSNAAGKMLEVDGLIGILRKLGYPQAGIQMEALEEELLKYSNAIRLDDDLTFIEIRFE
ncbi:MAG: SpoIIE family protein phosphatase [Candidatus Nealsonbacteria bacterium]|nr:SpoIIE family protein phosphatase [Candidatus Nealsonbacteria bacterium]